MDRREWSLVLINNQTGSLEIKKGRRRGKAAFIASLKSTIAYEQFFFSKRLGDSERFFFF